jgi:hypothetical protein
VPTISTVAICNMALTHIGADSTIESIDEDSAEANACKTWFDWSRVQVLELSDWSFARKRVTLALHGDAAPEGDWLYRYEYPSDCVNARYIPQAGGWTDDATPFVVEVTDDGSEKTILTDMGSAVLVYTFDQKNSMLWSSGFIDALALRLASNIAFTLTGSRELAAQLAKDSVNAVGIAAASNANEGREREPREAEGIRARA